MFILLPDYENRLRLLGIMMASAMAEFAVSDLAMLAGHAEGMSARDIKNWVANALKIAVERAVARGGVKLYESAITDLLGTAGALRERTTEKKYRSHQRHALMV